MDCRFNDLKNGLRKLLDSLQKTRLVAIRRPNDVIGHVNVDHLRVSNFVEIQIDRDLIKENDKWFIVIRPEEIKTRTHLEFQIPEDLKNNSRRISTIFGRACSPGLNARRCGSAQKGAGSRRAAIANELRCCL